MTFFGHVVKGSIRKMRLISNFLTSQPGKRTNVVHILLNISRRKDNETLKFGQLIECNMRNVFLEKSYAKCGRKTISRLFSKKIKIEHISGSMV